jgi:uncharacterized protein DUF4232
MERPGGGSRADRVLEEWSAVAGTAQRPVDPVLDRGPLTRLRGISLAAAGAVVAVLVAAVWLGGGGFRGGVGGPGAIESPSPAPAASPTPSAGPSASPVASAVAACTAADLEAKVTNWTGAAGSRIATVHVTNASAHPCALALKLHAQLVDANLRVLIDGTAPKGTKTIRLEPKGTAQTEVEVGNYCGKNPAVAPATIAFAFPDGSRLVATAAADSVDAVPPCNGPTQPGSIQMHAWSA